MRGDWGGERGKQEEGEEEGGIKTGRTMGGISINDKRTRMGRQEEEEGWVHTVRTIGEKA